MSIFWPFRVFCNAVMGNKSHYNSDGEFIGWTTPDGKHYDSDGIFIGWTDSSGRIFNRTREIIGNISNGNFYSSFGDPLGHYSNGEIIDTNGNSIDVFEALGLGEGGG